jgi:glycosyltransferase involved in cell wall biosynthesis
MKLAGGGECSNRSDRSRANMQVIVTSPSWSLNGINTFSANLVRGLRIRGVDATLLLTGITYVERKPLPIPQDIPVEQLVIPRFATWRARRRALLQLLESRAPCVYFPNHDFLHSSVASALSPEVGVVGIVHSDDPQHYDHASRMGSSWNAAVAVSDRIAAQLLELRSVDPSRLSVIPYGVEVADTVPDTGPDRHDRGDLRIIYAGRLDSAQKRSHDLVGIAASLSRRQVPFTLTIVGDGPERKAIERGIVATGLSDKVKMIGTVSNDRMAALYRDFDAFLLPSAYEGMPLALLEAMGQGCVPFATEVDSGVPQLIRHGENGFTAPVGNVEQFAALLETFGRSQDRKRLSREAWKSVSSDGYRTADMIGRYAETLEKVEADIDSGTFRRSGSISRVSLPLRETIAAPLWSLRPAIRAQQNLTR